ncbi:class I adenylate-forming enzyme family protein [Umezawaea tangerina]|uniref:Acyl-CoA synthetase (AMP-forming)/AMP-acid ligase II n=1 Tax=Umezawaea tangerina TaxID=84725 RepID=A0A2T0SZJ1_9PSEU|nr:fatty acid--CoA ligase family protein [Umezawaea tangerina]PRY38835.1 acyl-CoA synthetase (AMP-forming)/AMP-acid ligase II [Umezawaea tangerina]
MGGGMRALLDELFEAHPGGLPYLVHDERVVDRDEVRASVAAEAKVFGGFGIGDGSAVLVQVPSSRTQVEVVFALWSLGAQVMLVDHRLAPAEVEALRGLCRPEFTVRATAGGRFAMAFQPTYELVTKHHRDGERAATDHRLVQFSSGSTGLPKVIGRTPGSLAAEVERFTRIDRMPTAGERVLLLSSTAHSFGLVAGLLHSLAAGVAAVFTPRLSAKDVLATAERHDVHAIFGTPFHYELLTTTRSVPVLPSLRAAVSGGELMPAGVAEAFRERFGVGLGESYGTTETGVIAMDVSGDLRPAVGRAAPGVVLRVADGELEVELPEGTPYLFESGSGAAASGHPATERYVDGWLRTHDRASQDERGAVRLLGRSDSLVVIGGLKVDLVEVESVLRQHPRVTDVVVVHAESIEAYVSAEDDGPGAGELVGWCRDRLAAYKVPRLVRVLPSLPRTPNGKLIRRTQTLRAAVPEPS